MVSRLIVFQEKLSRFLGFLCIVPQLQKSEQISTHAPWLPETRPADLLVHMLCVLGITVFIICTLTVYAKIDNIKERCHKMNCLMYSMFNRETSSMFLRTIDSKKKKYSL